MAIKTNPTENNSGETSSAKFISGTATSCPYCGVGCGVRATLSDDMSVTISGDDTHPANFGRLCSKGLALGETLSLDERLLHPTVENKKVDWDSALELVASKFSAAIAEHGPHAVAFYVSGQLLTEDYYVANKLMKGFIGSGNIDTNSRVCMASSVAGHKRAFGSDTVPGSYEDLEHADLVVLVGSNLAWCHPVLYQRLASAVEERGTKVVVIDPRRSATCDIADLHLPIAPGGDLALFHGLLRYLDRNGHRNSAYVFDHTSGCKQALAEASTYDEDKVASITGLDIGDIAAFYSLVANTEKTVTVYSQGVNQSTSGTDKVNSIINCHLFTGRIGRPGMGPFSVTGQPNAMGGREVGGLANQLASHMELSNPEHRSIVQTFWSSPKIADKDGLKAIDLFTAVGDGRIKALWIMGTNPAVSLPEARKVREAIEACPFVVVSEVVERTDTSVLADVLLPATAWGEKDGTVTNSERRISRQRAFLPSPGEARADWWIICEVAKRMGFGYGFDFDGPFEIFDEHARLSATGNNGRRDFDIGALSGMDSADYNALEPTLWPARSDALGSNASTSSSSRLFADGGFFTPDRKARFICAPRRAAASAVAPERPLVLNTGRIRDQWHTMTRTGKSARLMGHVSEPFVEVHPDDANRLGLEPATLARISSDHGSSVARVLITERARKGSVFVPMHWNDQFSSSGPVDGIVGANVDPVSGQPESKFTPVLVEPWPASWFGFAILARKPANLTPGYWAVAPADGGWRIEMAGLEADIDWPSFARELFGISVNDKPGFDDLNAGDLQFYLDRAKGQHRLIGYDGEQLLGALFVAPQPVTVSRTWASSLLLAQFDSPNARLHVLAGRPGKDQPDPGAIVCACLQVGVNQITNAVMSENCTTVDEVGTQLGAGTGCGSCRGEIRGIIEQLRQREAG